MAFRAHHRFFILQYEVGLLSHGLNAYVYQQVSGDAGSGAQLGSFEGRTVGVGPSLIFFKQFGKITTIAEVKWLPEVEVHNRLKGNWVWVKIGIDRVMK